MPRPSLSPTQMFNMSFGFLGIQFGWGLQLANMSAVYERLGARPDEVPLLWLAAPVTGLLVQPIVGALSDRVGRRPLYLAGAVGVAAWSWVFFDLIASRSEGKIILAIVVGLVLHALMYAPQAAFFSELFGTSVRYTGASVGYQLASIFAGALAPIIAIELLGDASEGVTNVPKVAIYMTIASVITIIAVLVAQETKASSLRHDRVLQD